MAKLTTTKFDFSAILAIPDFWPPAGSFTIGFDTSDDKLKKLDSAGVLTIIGEDGFFDPIIPITLANLEILKDAGTLVEGVRYYISDLSEPILILATSATTLSQSADLFTKNLDFQGVGNYTGVQAITGFAVGSNLGLWRTTQGTLGYDQTLLPVGLMFLPNETIQGGTSSATATVYFNNGDALTIRNIVGSFQAGETITGLTSGASSTISAPGYSFNPVQGDIVIWDGFHWQKTTNNILSTDPTTDGGANFQQLLKTDANQGYITEIDPVIYDTSDGSSANWAILQRSDRRGNIVKTTTSKISEFGFNPIDRFQWGKDGVINNIISSSNFISWNLLQVFTNVIINDSVINLVSLNTSMSTTFSGTRIYSSTLDITGRWDFTDAHIKNSTLTLISSFDRDSTRLDSTKIIDSTLNLTSDNGSTSLASSEFVSANQYVVSDNVDNDYQLMKIRNNQFELYDTPAFIKTFTCDFEIVDLEIDDSNLLQSGETIGTGDGLQTIFPFTLSFPLQHIAVIDNIVAGTVVITGDSTPIETFSDDGLGNLTGDQGGSGTIDYNTGAGSVTFNSAPASIVTADYATIQAMRIRMNEVNSFSDGYTPSGIFTGGTLAGWSNFITNRTTTTTTDIENILNGSLSPGLQGVYTFTCTALVGDNGYPEITLSAPMPINKHQFVNQFLFRNNYDQQLSSSSTAFATYAKFNSMEVIGGGGSIADHANSDFTGVKSHQSTISFSGGGNKINAAGSQLQSSFFGGDALALSVDFSNTILEDSSLFFVSGLSISDNSNNQIFNADIQINGGQLKNSYIKWNGSLDTILISSPIINKRLESGFSNIESSLDLSGSPSTTIGLGKEGTVNIFSSSPSETIDTIIIADDVYHPIEIRPIGSPALTLTIVHGTGPDQPRLAGGIDVTLFGQNGDYIILQKKSDGNIYQVGGESY